MKLLHPFTLSMGAAAICTIGIFAENSPILRGYSVLVSMDPADTYPRVNEHMIWLTVYAGWICGFVAGVVVLSRAKWRTRWIAVCQENLAKDKKNALFAPLVTALISLLPMAIMSLDADNDRPGSRGHFLMVLIGVHRSDWTQANIMLAIYSAFIALIVGFFVVQVGGYLYLLARRTGLDRLGD